MSSNTSAYLSSQTEISETITAGVWVVPEVDECGEIIANEEGLALNEESLILGEENIDSCEDSNNEDNEENLNNPIDEAICENQDDVIFSETDLIDCINSEMEPTEDYDEDIEGQVIEKEEPINENEGLEESIEKEKDNDKDTGTEKLQEKSKDEIKKQPGNKEEPISEQVDKNPVVVDESTESNSDEETNN